MPKANVALLAFNRGLISPLAIARTDLERIQLSAETQTNWMPRSLGSMMLRPGFEYITSTKSNNQARYVPFVFSNSDTALIELTNTNMRVLVSETAVTRASVSSAVTNGGFDSDVASWTDDDESGATSAWATGGYLSLIGTGFKSAIRTQEITVAGGDQNVEHALRIVINRGPVVLRVGTSSGDDSYVSETTLGTGTHSLAFTPTGNFFIQVSNIRKAASLVDSINVEASGVMEITLPYATADLRLIRHEQSGDVIYLSCVDYQQRKIERRGTNSWSLVLYEPEDGPFDGYNATEVTIASSAISGDVTLTASSPLFKSTHVGSLLRIDSLNQVVEASITAENSFTDPIRVTGSGADRSFTLDLTGTWSATATLQRSTDSSGPWTDISTYTANTSLSGSQTVDGLDNQIIYYRIGVKTGDFTSGQVDAQLSFSSGSITGVCKITAYSSSTSASARVITDLGSADASANWAFGSWSTQMGWPSSVGLYEGRLWWAGKDKVWGSVSDAYESFDPDVAGDSGTIARTIGSGPVDTINWILSMHRLILGAQSAEKSARSSSFDEPLTPTNFTLKNCGTHGSSAISPVVIDSRGIFVHKSGTRVMELAFDPSKTDYSPTDLTLLAPEATNSEIVALGVQRMPDTRVHAVRADGKVALMVNDPAENVLCWILVETDGVVEDVVVLPGDVEDTVYYVVNRTIEGSTVRYLEKWALESECVGGTLNKQADSFVSYTGASTTTVTAAHLASEDVVIWADGAYVGTATLDGSGQTTLATAATNYVVGLSYTAQYKSTKLAYASGMGTALLQRKIIPQIGVIARNLHASGLQYGPDFDNLDDMPLTEGYADVDADTIHSEYDEDMFVFNGTWNTDSRICLQATAPKPATVLACVLTVVTHDKG